MTADVSGITGRPGGQVANTAPAAPATSIRKRLLRTQLLWSLLWGLALALAVWLAVADEVDELMDDALQSSAEGLVGPLVLALTAAPPVIAGPGVQHNGAARFIWQRVAPGPRLVTSSYGAPAAPLRATPQAGFSDLPDWRVYGLAIGEGGHMLYVAQTRAERSEAKWDVIVAVGLASLSMLLLGGLWLNARVRHDLQPLQQLSTRLQTYDPLQPGASLGPAGDAELQPVHAAIDALAARLTSRIAHEQAFAAHAAHALRTPLAGIDAQLAVALREAPAALQPRLQRVRAASGRLQHVVAALLIFFRSGAEVQRLPIDLQRLAARLGNDALQLQVLPGAALSGDAELLQAVLMNLVDNALAHGATALTLATPEPGVLSVQDDGRGVTPAQLQGLQQALDEEDYAGRTGLGLMLADRVARAHGGRLRLLHAAPGFTVCLQLQPA